MTTRDRRGVPLVAALLAAVAVTFFVLPLLGLLQRAPWSDAWDDLTSPVARDAMRLSLECSLWSTALSLAFGVPLAYTLARGTFPGRSLVRAVVVLPMVLPPVVGGVALLYAFSVNNGVVGGWLHDIIRAAAHVLEGGRGAGGDVRRDAVPRDHRRGGAPVDGSSLRGRGGEPRREPLDGLPASHAAVDRALVVRRRGAGVGARIGRVRCHDHVRRQHPGSDPDHAARGLPAAGVGARALRSC